MKEEIFIESQEPQKEKNELLWTDLGFNRDPFFTKEVTNRSQADFFSSRKSEIKNIVDKVTIRSLPFVLENKIESETPYVLKSVVDKLLGKEGENLEKNKSVPVIIDCENLDEDKIKEVAFSKLIYNLCYDGRLSYHIRGKLNSDISLPDSLIETDEKTKDLIERFDMPNLNLEQYADMIGDTLGDGQIIFILSNLEKIEDEEEKIKFIEKWHYRIQKIPNISIIYAGNEGMDDSLRKAYDFYSHAPVKIGSIKKEDLKDILDNRVKALSDRYSNIDDFLCEDIWNMLRKADRGENVKWILGAMSKIVEKYKQNKKEINTPIKYDEIKNDIKTLFDKSIPTNLEPIMNKLANIFENSIEALMSDDELTDDNWKDLGINRSLNSDIIDDSIEMIPESPQARGELLNELEKMGFLQSKRIKRKKYYLPVDDFMLSLEIKRREKENLG